jgi:hypothetical protein
MIWASELSEKRKPIELIGSSAVTPEESPISGDLTVHQIIMLVTLISGVAATALSMLLVASHATHYSRPQEQKP